MQSVNIWTYSIIFNTNIIDMIYVINIRRELLRLNVNVKTAKMGSGLIMSLHVLFYRWRHLSVTNMHCCVKWNYWSNRLWFRFARNQSWYVATERELSLVFSISGRWFQSVTVLQNTQFLYMSDLHRWYWLWPISQLCYLWDSHYIVELWFCSLDFLIV
jgi:hypothetical protein